MYSLDMCRYNFELLEDNIEPLNKLFNTFSYEPGLTITSYSTRSLGYKFLYKLSMEDNSGCSCSFSIGVCLNSKSENKNKGFIEFNPNKCMQVALFSKFFERFLNICLHLTLIRYDCAIDIPVSRDLVKMIKNPRCNYEYVTTSKKDSSGFTISRSVTEYQGVRNNNKFTKLYDKKNESKLDYDLTRIEFTFERQETDFKNLASFVVYDSRFTNSNTNFVNISSRDLVLIDLLRNSEDVNFYLGRLSYRLRKKIEPYLGDITLRLNLQYILNVRDLALYFEI